MCQGCFLKTLDISDNFVKLIWIKRRSSANGIIEPNQRGRKAPSTKHSADKIQEIINYINFFPLYESHYTRHKSTCKYLPSHLTISKMYSLYSESHTQVVSDKMYRREFHKLNLKFEKSKVDTCHACDVFKMKLEIATDDRLKHTIILTWMSPTCCWSSISWKKSRQTAVHNNKIRWLCSICSNVSLLLC